MIVVLVILAILAAMMVPALLGWIDEARNKEYVLQARSVYMAAQALADKAYGKAQDVLYTDDLDLTEIANLSDVTVTSLLGCNVKDKTKTYQPEAFEITEMHFVFTSSKGGSVAAALTADGEWKIKVGANAVDNPPTFTINAIAAKSGG